MSSESTAVSLAGRYFNAACYLVSGIVLVALAASRGGGALVVLVGIALGLYGAYVGLTRGSYWVSSYTYVIPFGAIVLGIAAVNH